MQKPYDDEFKMSVVQMLLIEGRDISTAAEELDIPESVLKEWQTAYAVSVIEETQVVTGQNTISDSAEDDKIAILSDVDFLKELQNIAGDIENGPLESDSSFTSTASFRNW